MTTLDELIETLEGIREAGVDGDTEMRILIQPNYPLQFTMGNLGVLPGSRKLEQAQAEADAHPEFYPDGVEDVDAAPFADEVKVVYITTGVHPDDSPYGPSFGRLADPGEIEEDPDLDRDSEEEPDDTDPGDILDPDDDEPRHAREDRRYEMKFGASPED